MLSSYCIEEMLGIKDAIVQNVKNDPHKREIHITFELAHDIVTCPQCKKN